MKGENESHVVWKGEGEAAGEKKFCGSRFLAGILPYKCVFNSR